MAVLAAVLDRVDEDASAISPMNTDVISPTESFSDAATSLQNTKIKKFGYDTMWDMVILFKFSASVMRGMTIVFILMLLIETPGGMGISTSRFLRGAHRNRQRWRLTSSGVMCDRSALTAAATANYYLSELAGNSPLMCGDYQSVVAAMGECWECKFPSNIFALQRLPQWHGCRWAQAKHFVFLCLVFSQCSSAAKANSTRSRTEATEYDTTQPWSQERGCDPREQRQRLQHVTQRWRPSPRRDRIVVVASRRSHQLQASRQWLNGQRDGQMRHFRRRDCRTCRRKS